MDQVGDLVMFSTVARSGSLAQAAQALNISPSGVSRRLSRFEDRLGVRLFNRTTRTLSLTEPGIYLLERCDDILWAVEEAESTVSQLRQKPRGTLRVAASDAFSLIVLVPFLESFQAKFPDLKVILLQGDGPIDLLGSNLDLAIRFELPSATSLIVKKLISDPWVICAAPSYLARFGPITDPNQLADHRCLAIHARGRTDNRWEFRNAEDQPYHLEIPSVISGIGLVNREAALAGLGVARLAHFLVRDRLASGELVQVLADHMPNDNRSIFAVYPERQFLPSKVRYFLDALSEFMKDRFH
ncbi:MAG: LysR family transcriptional regulator [Pseudomonadota bacterium]